MRYDKYSMAVNAWKWNNLVHNEIVPLEVNVKVFKIVVVCLVQNWQTFRKMQQLNKVPLARDITKQILQNLVLVQKLSDASTQI